MRTFTLATTIFLIATIPGFSQDDQAQPFHENALVVLNSPPVFFEGYMDLSSYIDTQGVPPPFRCVELDDNPNDAWFYCSCSNTMCADLVKKIKKDASRTCKTVFSPPGYLGRHEKDAFDYESCRLRNREIIERLIADCEKADDDCQKSPPNIEWVTKRRKGEPTIILQLKTTEDKKPDPDPNGDGTSP